MQTAATYTDRSFVLIVLFVLSAHIALFLFALSNDHLVVQPKRQEKVKLVVKTVNLKQEQPKEKIAVLPTPFLEPKILKEPDPLPIPKPKPEPKIASESEPIPAPEPIASTKPKIETPRVAPKAKSVKKAQNTPKPVLVKKGSQKKEAQITKPVIKPTPKPAVTTKTKPKVEKPQPKPDPAVEAAKVKRQELLANAQKSISKVQQGRDKVIAKSDIVVPESVSMLEIEKISFSSTAEEYTPQQRSYYDELESRMKLQLRLPDYGTVKIKLTLESSGKYVKMTIVNAKSSANKAYIEKMLPTLKYPGFGDHFGSEKQHTFIISLSNDL